MTSAQVVETSVNVISNSPSQDYTHPDDRTLPYDMTPGFKPFTILINTVITRSEVPDTWKHGQITPHHKKHIVLDKENYRPVTVLPVFGKVFERIAHMQMSNHFEPILHKYMFAYRKFHGCSTALLI